MVYTDSHVIGSKRDGAEILNDLIAKDIEKSGIKNGIAVIQSCDPTVGIVRTAVKDTVLCDVISEIRKIVPARINFKNEESPEDAAGHIKAAIFGQSLTLALKDGALLGMEGMGVFMLDYDGPQNRKIDVLIMGE